MRTEHCNRLRTKQTTICKVLYRFKTKWKKKIHRISYAGWNILVNCVYGRPLSATNCTYQIPMERPLIVHLTNDFSKTNHFLLLVWKVWKRIFLQQKIKIRDTNRKWFLDILSILLRSQFQFTIKLLNKLEILLLVAIKHCQVQWNHDFLIKSMLHI